MGIVGGEFGGFSAQQLIDGIRDCHGVDCNDEECSLSYGGSEGGRGTLVCLCMVLLVTIQMNSLLTDLLYAFET